MFRHHQISGGRGRKFCQGVIFRRRLTWLDFSVTFTREIFFWKLKQNKTKQNKMETSVIFGPSSWRRFFPKNFLPFFHTNGLRLMNKNATVKMMNKNATVKILHTYCKRASKHLRVLLLWASYHLILCYCNSGCLMVNKQTLTLLIYIFFHTHSVRCDE